MKAIASILTASDSVICIEVGDDVQRRIRVYGEIASFRKLAAILSVMADAAEYADRDQSIALDPSELPQIVIQGADSLCLECEVAH